MITYEYDSWGKIISIKDAYGNNETSNTHIGKINPYRYRSYRMGEEFILNMSLRIIYGRAGTGKSEFCFNEIKNIINNKEKIYIITPEQFSYTAEKKLLNSIGKKAVINAEVLTFNRMAYRVINEVGGKTKTTLSKTGKAMLIYNILSKQKGNLTFLGKSDENIETVLTSIREFKMHGISCYAIKEEINKAKDIYLKLKIQDMSTMYEQFENTIQNKFIDEDDVLTILSEKLDKTDMFKNTVIYIDEFLGFTYQEQKIISKLLKVCKQVNITTTIDDLNESKNPDTDIFYSNKQTIRKIISLAKDEKIQIENTVFLKETKRFKCEQLKHLEKNIYETQYKKLKNNENNVKLFLANNQFSEVENVAKTILHLVRDENYKYEEISIITKNMDNYSSVAKAIFNKYNIPIFIDEKEDLNKNVLIKYVLSVIEIFAKNWSYETMFNYIKSPFVDLSKNEKFILENYCIKWGIKGNKWYKEDWKVASSDDEKKILNDLRKKVITPLLNFNENLKRTKTVEQITKQIYNFLLENNINVKLNNLIKDLENKGFIELANIYKVSWDTLINVLDEMVLILGDNTISFDEYSKIFKIGMKNSSLGKIPATQDEVMMGDVERSRTHKVKVVFILGLNDGQFPSINTDEGFFNDENRKDLKEHGIELASGTIENLYEENFNIYKAFTIAEERLYLSYASSDNSGKSLRPSTLIAKIKKILQVEQTSDITSQNEEITTIEATFEQLLDNIRKHKEQEEINPIWYDIYKIYKDNPEWNKKLQYVQNGLKSEDKHITLSKEVSNKLYKDVLNTSISRLEQYKKCAFSYYLKYGLKLSEKSLFKIESLDTGTFMHDVIDEFFSQVIQRNIKLKQIEEEQINQIIDSIINEKLEQNRNYIFRSSDKYKILTMRLKRVIKKSMKYIIETITNSDFEILGNELEFNKNGKFEPITIQLDNNKKVEITGKIDRIDLAKNKDGKYIRIIDYKSSIKNIDLNEVVAGLQIQLLTYLDAVSKTDNFLPAGVLYFNLIDPIIKSNKNMTNEEIEEEIKKNFKMQGLILADVNVVKMMDKKLETGFSSLVPAYIDSKGNLSENRSSTVSKEEFKNLQKYMNKIIKQISKEIMSGNIDIKPYYNTKNKKTPCEYCKYKPICNFNGSVNEYNYINNLKREEILEKIKE